MVDYAVEAVFELRDQVSPILDKIMERLDKTASMFAEFQERLDRLGGAGISRLLEQMDRLGRASFPSQLVDGADRFDRALGGADAKMADLAKSGAELARVMRDIRVPTIPAAPAGRGSGRSSGGAGHGGGDPIMAGIEGGAVLEFMAANYERYSSVDQVYRALQADRNLAGPNNPLMAAIAGQAPGQMSRYRTLHPLDVAKNAGEAYGLSGGDMTEQAAIADVLDRLEQNMVLRTGMNHEDAQRQATALVKAGDIGNRYFDPKTGHFSISKANAELDRMQALIAVGGGFTTGQGLLSFEKSAKLAGQRLDLEGEAELAHFVEIDPRNAGNRLNSLENLFGGHANRMAKKDKAFWTQQGLYDKHGNLKDTDLLYRRPLEWIERHFSGLSSETIDNHTQRMGVSAFAQETTGSIGNTNRQAAAVARSNVNANEQNLLNSPLGQMLQFEASMDKFRTSLGKFEAGPGAMILDKLTSGLDKITAVMTAHPEASENLLKFAAGLSAVAVIRGVSALTGIGDGLGVLGKSLSLFSKGAAAETALEGLAATAGAGSLFGLSAGIVALGAAVIGLPPLMRHVFGTDGTPHLPTNARGHATVNQDPNTPSTNYDPQQEMKRKLDSLWQDMQHPQSRGNARGLASHAAFLGDMNQARLQPINLVVDGRTLATVLMPHVTAGRIGPTDSLNVNTRIAPMRPSQTYRI